MAPSLPVYTRDEIKSLYPDLFPERIPRTTNSNTSSDHLTIPNFKLDLENCKLHTLTQNQCTFDGNQVVCIPFKRIFARCLDSNYYNKKELIGFKLTPAHSQHEFNQKDHGKEVYRNVELTQWFDNDYSKVLEESKSGVKGKDGKGEVDADLIKEFLKADKILKKKMAEYYENMLKNQKKSGGSGKGDSDS
ncbi:unnamed protein product [Ambrosiozyma monospora]|uniref:Unnamed protein product n=1 Tax=Ambrosiozyma monospora TaxID=43982 RepID=A0ACB5T073_AMBMO|nr:unnamed protein product [Ambrosiozyma monospora]